MFAQIIVMSPFSYGHSNVVMIEFVIRFISALSHFLGEHRYFKSFFISVIAAMFCPCGDNRNLLVWMIEIYD